EGSMRQFAIIFAAFVLCACGQAERDAAGDCTLSATRALTWPEGDARLTATASAAGADCASATLTLELRSDDGAMTHTFAAPYAELAHSAAPTPEEVQRFLNSWADVTQMRSSTLPAWAAFMSRPGEGVDLLPYESALPRADYEALRARNLPTICIARGVAMVECF